MSSCPRDEQLASLLDERLGVEDLALVETHLEGCLRCQQTLEELTYERFSAAEWHSSGDGPGLGSTVQSIRGGDSERSADPPLLDSKIQAEQDSRRKRLILESFPRQPSSLHFSALKNRDSSVDALNSTYPPQVAGYDIVGQLGRGGMGVVYRARQHGLDRLVALKMLRGGSQADPEALARFRIEVRAVARLRHPNVVQVFDVGESQGLPFVSLELLEGGSLEARNGGNPQPERESATLMATLSRAIASAHRVGIVHRDLKPANVLFSRDGIPKITDFGLAKRLDEDDGQTHSGQVMGSPSFMAPEQARGEAKEVSPAADIYSLGAILYGVLTGRPPFKGGSPLETLHQVVHIEPVAPSKLRPGLARDLETICLKCLSKESSKRYATADDLAEDLDRFLAGAPIEARRVRILERAWKWSRREPAAASLALAVGLAVVASTFAGFRAVEASKKQTERLTIEGSKTLLLASAAIRDRRWGEGRPLLKIFLRDAGDEPSLTDLRHQAKTLLAQIDQGEANQKDRDEARSKLQRFAQATRRAQLIDAHATLSSRPDQDDPRPIRHAAEAALGLMGRFDRDSQGRPEAWNRVKPSPWLDDSERAEADSSCRELRLIWIEAIGKPATGEDAKSQALRALTLLDQSPEGDSPSKAEWFLRARLSDRVGDPASAEKDRSRAESAPVLDVVDRVASARVFQLRGDWSRAISEYEAALGLDPNQFQAQIALAVCQLQAGQPEAARSGFTACLRSDRKSFDLLLLRGIAGGEAAFQSSKRGKGHDLVADDPERLFRAAEDDFEAAENLALSDHDRLTLRLDRGIVRVRANRLLEAEADFAEAARLDPDHLAVRVNWGQVLLRLGRNDDAVAQLTRAIEIEPTRPELFRARAIARLDRRDPPEETGQNLALEDLNEAIRLGRPGTADLAGDHARRARLLHRAGRFEAALADSDEALRIKPDQVDAPLIRVRTLLELKRYGEMIRACDEALTRRPDVADFWELRGVARSHRQDFAAALGDFTQALTLEPARLSARTQRGWAYLISDASKLALADFEAVIERNPDEAEAYGGRGFALALAGQYRLATADAEESLRKSRPDDARTCYNAARIYARAAAGSANSSAGRRPSISISLADEYGERALSLIRSALDRLPVDRRSTFYREVVQSDPALANLRQRPQFARLAGQLGKPTQ